MKLETTYPLDGVQYKCLAMMDQDNVVFSISRNDSGEWHLIYEDIPEPLIGTLNELKNMLIDRYNNIISKSYADFMSDCKFNGNGKLYGGFYKPYENDENK